MKTAFTILTLFLVLFAKNVFSQEAFALTMSEIYRNSIMSQHKARIKGQDDLLDKMDEKTKQLEEMSTTMESIYEGYLAVVHTFETATGVLNTYRELVQFKDYLEKINEIYEYGIGFTFYNMYGFDKYLNPDLQKMYIRRLENCVKHSAELGADLLTFVPPSGSGSMRMRYEEGLVRLRQMCMDMRGILYDMYSVTYLFMYLCEARREADAMIEFRNTFFDPAQYHYTVVWKNN